MIHRGQRHLPTAFTWRLVIALLPALFCPWSESSGVEPVQRASPTLSLLTNAAHIRLLSPAEAKQGYPVQVRGTVVYCSLKRPGNFVLQDERTSLFVLWNPQTNVPPITRGQWVEVQGISGMPSASAGVRATNLLVLGSFSLPEPRPLTYEQLTKGNEDSQWVEVRGIVRAVPGGKRQPSEVLPIELMMPGGRLLVRVEQYDLEQAQSLIDAEVRVRGLCFYYSNEQGQLFNVRVSVQELADIVVEKPAASDPQATPVTPVNQLLLYNSNGRSEHRAHVKGKVISPLANGSFYLTDETQGIQIFTGQTLPLLAEGDEVDVLGFAEMGEYSPTLRDAAYKRIISGPPIASLSSDPVKALTQDASLVRIQARLLELIRQPQEVVLVLQSGEAIFNAHLKTSAPALALNRLRNGSTVELTGVCEVKVGDLSEFLKMTGTRTPSSFRILLRSAKDVVILKPASWWTLTHALWVLAGVGTTCLGGLVWIATLRRRVHLQTQIIRHKIEHEAVMEERARIARDMHDDLGARLTQIGLLNELSKRQPSLPAETYHSMQRISDTTRDAVRAMDEIVWALNPRNDSLGSLLEFFSQYANEYLRETGILCRQDFPEAVPEWQVNSGMRHHLLLAFKEALQNTVKHSGATEVWLRVSLENGMLNLCIEDNGCGFQPAANDSGRDGVTNIQARMSAVGGECQFHNAPGKGAIVSLKILLESPERQLPAVPLMGDSQTLDKTL